ncbi:TOBE domain-containing protein [Pseudomonas sp. Au-Pse12]|uniref:TOBE domain-containing protein n=1 Tax=Pseudomonas sp. Au-Pse12 TaxID=2906459 RepID=UPI001E43E15A|nr:TOBE domain-containing protein [Pseudomonas sp. Au-Pse12]MCE4053085.1 TOBE domain-containing protein [Pseudomonas sp. Au-Pse12]
MGDAGAGRSTLNQRRANLPSPIVLTAKDFLMATIPVVLALGHDSNKPIASNRVRLLEGIEHSGSITSAAEFSGMSYRSALTSIESLEELSGCQLVIKTVGGKHGGGAELTAEGRKLIEAYRLIEKFQTELASQLGDHQSILYAYNRMMLKTSARNQLQGVIGQIDDEDDIVDTLSVRISDTDTLNVTVTKESTAELGLRPGVQVSLLIKAPSITLAATPAPAHGVNRLQARVVALQKGRSKSRLKLRLADEIGISSIVATGELPAGGLLEGSHVQIDIDAEHILIGISF